MRCAASGMFLSDATQNLEVIAVTSKAERAHVMTDGRGAESLRGCMARQYPSFDWRVVERDAHTTAPQEAVLYLMQGRG
jgi:hypothetical protein